MELLIWEYFDTKDYQFTGNSANDTPTNCLLNIILRLTTKKPHEHSTLLALCELGWVMRKHFPCLTFKLCEIYLARDIVLAAESWHHRDKQMLEAILNHYSWKTIRYHIPQERYIQHCYRALNFNVYKKYNGPDNKFHGTNMGPTWVLSAPDEPHVGPMDLAIRRGVCDIEFILIFVQDLYCNIHCCDMTLEPGWLKSIHRQFDW